MNRRLLKEANSCLLSNIVVAYKIGKWNIRDGSFRFDVLLAVTPFKTIKDIVKCELENDVEGKKCYFLAVV